MKSKLISGAVLTLFLIGMLTLAFNIQPAKASGTIYIRADGSVEPSTANITSTDNVTYIFTDNNYEGIVVERDNIVLDGAGYTVQGTGTGIDVSYRSNVTVKNTVVTGFFCGICLRCSSNCTVSGNTANNNTLDGIFLGPLVGSITGSNNNTVLANNASNNGYGGIRLEFSGNNTVSGNTANNNEYGIWLYDSGNCTVSGNSANNNMYGIYLRSSSGSTVSGNTATNNMYGIRLWDSGNSSLFGNVMAGNRYNFGVGARYDNFVDLSNLADGKPIYYLKGVSNVVYDSSIDAATIYLIDSTNVTVRDLTLSNNVYGVVLGNTTNSRIENVTATNNTYGIYLHSASNNTILANNANNNGYGIRLYDSGNNFIYHNNFIDNRDQVWNSESNNTWDDGYPSGGNYWSDYNGTDAQYPENATGPPPDGIGDTPYYIDANNTDRYPLMGPISFFNAGTWNEVTYYAHTVSNSTVSDFYFSESKKLISFNVTGPEGSVGFCRVTIPNELLWCDTPEQWTVLVNNTAIHYWVKENGDRTYLYFDYSHSTQNVQIEGIHAIPEFPTWTSILLMLIVLSVAIAIYKLKLLKKHWIQKH